MEDIENTNETPIKFETANLAKQKGFDWKTEWAYQDRDGEKVLVHKTRDREEINWNAGNEYSCPTQAVLQKWLRDKFRIHIVIEGYKDETYDYMTQSNNGEGSILDREISEERFKVYEDALEAGLIQSLELIK